MILQHIAFRPVPLVLVGLSLVIGACAPSVRFQEDLDDYEGAIEALQRQVARNPDDADALRDLGVIYLRTSDYGKANEFLQLAFSRDSNDPKTLFNLGLVNEALGRHDTALRLYERYPEFSRLSPYRRLMAGRYAWVVRKRMRDEVQARVAQEDELAGEPLEPRIVAVYPLVYQGTDDRYAPLGRGLAELVTVDLGHVSSIRLVERSRLQALLDEIEFGQSEYVDPATAPRVGRLVGAGRLVGGVYNVLDASTLRLDATLWETNRTTMPELETQSDALSSFFRLEKRLVFAVIEEMGIELTPEERQQIEFIPTQNLQAFLAFSRGLESEDAGAFDDAASFFGQAAQLDPSFRLAQERSDEVGGQSVMQTGSLTDGLTAAFQQDPSPPLPTAPGLDIMTHRLIQLNGSLGSVIVPGIDARESSLEAGSGGVTFGRLPDPPPPPETGGGGN